MTGNIHLSSRTKTIALIAIFAALFAVLRRIDAIPMIGVPGARFSLSDILPPIYGIVLGPFTGGISVIIGTFLGIALGKPVIFLFLDFLPALVNTVAVGLLVRRKWWPVVLLYVALFVAFLVNPLTSIFIDVGGMAIPMMQHLMGNILYEVVLNQFYIVLGQNPIVATAAYPGIWSVTFFLYPWERLILIILTVVVGVPLVRVLKQSFFRSEKEPTAETKKL
jgi:hypothetical protein